MISITKGVWTMDITNVALSKATIQTNHLLNNIQAFKNLLAEDTKLMAVVKADAYSHGAISLSREMEAHRAADYFGVAQLSEALALREAGIETPILIFNAVRPQEIEYAVEQEITMTVFTSELASLIVQHAERLEKEATVHIKIDTGMARLGVTTFEEAYAIYQRLQSDFVSVEGIFTHFADAKEDSPENYTHEQFSRFKHILDQFETKDITFDLRHSCNTAGTINFPDYHLDMVRVGLGLYGLNPSVNNQDKIKLTPIQTVETTVTFVKDFPAGESVGYGRTYVAKEPIRIATVAIGYADGVAKSLSNKGFFTYKGQRVPILGEVCMDQIMLDVSAVLDIQIGDLVSYFGNPADGNIQITEVAKTAIASQYDLLCRMGSRVKRVYIEGEV